MSNKQMCFECGGELEDNDNIKIFEKNLYHEKCYKKAINRGEGRAFECPKCNGSGELENKTECEICNGHGYTYEEFEPIYGIKGYEKEEA